MVILYLFMLLSVIIYKIFLSKRKLRACVVIGVWLLWLSIDAGDAVWQKTTIEISYVKLTLMEIRAVHK